MLKKMEFVHTEVFSHLNKIYSACSLENSPILVPKKEDSHGSQICTRFDTLLKNLATPPSFTVLRLNLLKDSKENIIRYLHDALQKQYVDKTRKSPSIHCHAVLSDVVFMKNSGPHADLKKLSKEVIVDLSCGMAVMRGAHVFAQGIMGAYSGMVKEDSVSVYADVDGTCKKGLMKTFTGSKLFVGNGVAQLSRQELYCRGKEPSGVGILMSHPMYDAPCLSDLLPQYVFAQNLPSIICSHVLDPQPGETILDMCAAPGGKTTHIASLMKDTGCVIAMDKAKKKISLINRNVKRWNLNCVKAYYFDSTKACDINPHRKEISEGPPFSHESFDRILLDAPCSALGQRPSLKNKMTLNELLSYPKYQKNLFSQAVPLLKPGGVLVYSTCTLTIDENEAIVDWALKEFTDISLASQEPHIGGTGLPDATSLTSDQLQLLQRFDPSRLPSSDKQTVDNDTLGFFIAKFTKR